MNLIDFILLTFIGIALFFAIRYRMTHQGCGCNQSCKNCKKACVK